MELAKRLLQGKYEAVITTHLNTEISMADRLHIICTTLDGLSKIKENE